MDTGSLKVARIGGVEIKVHWSWAIIMLMVTFELAVGYFPMHVPGAADATYWVLGLVTALLLFVSVLLHELSHSFMAQRRGLRVRDITLFIFGGAASIESEPERPGDEFAIAIVGPLTSFVLAALFFGVGQVVSPVGQVGASVVAVMHDLAYINLLLGAFNMIPGFPLDGGRVLRSIIWSFNRNFQAATSIAGFVGQIVAYIFIFWGVYQTFVFGDFSGLWIAFIGWFLLSSARQSTDSVKLQETVRGVTVGQVMGPGPEPVGPQATLEHVVNRYLLPHNLRAIPVSQDGDGHFDGLVTLDGIKKVPQDQWATVRAGQVMISSDKLPSVQPGAPLDQALQLLHEGEVEQLPVLDPSGRLVGMLDRERVLRWLQIRDALKLNTSGRS